VPGVAETYPDPRENADAHGPTEASLSATHDSARRAFVRWIWSQRRHVFGDWVIAVLGLGAACLMLGYFHGFFLRAPRVLAFDEGYTTALAERMIEGRWLPYVDGVSHRGPLLYWAVAIFQELGGRFSWNGPRWLSAVLTFWTLLATFGAGAAARLPVAGAAGALMYVFLLSSYETISAFGILGETVASPMVMTALALTALAVFRLSNWRAFGIALFLAGVFAGLAGLAKQTSLGACAPLGVWALLHVRNVRDWTTRRKVAALLAFALGFALPITIVLVRYALARELGTFWYWYYEYNAHVYMRPFQGARLKDQLAMLPNRDHWLLLMVGVTTAALLSRAFASFGKRTSTGGFELTIALLTLVSVIGAIAPLRFFLHYYVPVFPLGALGAGVLVARNVRDGGGTDRWRKFAGVFALLAVFLLTLFVYDHRLAKLRRERRHGAWATPNPEPVCAYLDAHASPASPMFIWGFDADLYVTCHRVPATRFVYTTMIAGTVPGPWWSAPHPEGVARGARSQLMADLDASRPPIILELTANHGGIGMSIFPDLQERVVRDYCKQPSFKSLDKRVVIPWLLKENGACPSG
jgi:hypothetical protein